jgi:hypothetical protein
MRNRKTYSRIAGLPCILALIVLGTRVMTTVVTAAPPQNANKAQLIDDSQLQALSTMVGGASVLPTTRTILHWWGSTLDPHNGITYGYNMVGADPNNCSDSDCSVTIEADITPLGPNPDGTQSADGYYHPEDEVFLPWFMRLAPNTVSEPTQSTSGNVGRYTLMGDLHPFTGSRQPATGCN